MGVIGEVFIPKNTNKADTKAIQPKHSSSPDPEYWTKKAEELEAQAKYKLAEKQLENLTNPPQHKEQEPAFKITGGVNLGNFDLQAQQQETQKRMKELEEKYEGQIAQIGQQSENYRDQVTNLRIQMLQEQFKVQVDGLAKQLTVGATQPSLVDQLNRAKEMATALGYHPVAPGAQDVNTQIQLLKIQNDAAREEREFQWKMKQDEWARLREDKKVDTDAAVALERVKVDKERNTLFSGALDQVGQAIARGFMDSGSPSGISERPAVQEMKRDNSFHIEAGEGESGEAKCPKCSNPIGIGPTTKLAVCPSCNTKMPVARVAAAPVQSGPELSPEERDKDGG